jgi:hypothetical protein
VRLENGIDLVLNLPSAHLRAAHLNCASTFRSAVPLQQGIVQLQDELISSLNARP